MRLLCLPAWQLASSFLQLPRAPDTSATASYKLSSIVTGSMELWTLQGQGLQMGFARSGVADRRCEVHGIAHLLTFTHTYSYL